ncbi:hypothetical protein D0815_23020 [Vibrio parahaemolyticus]|nr:hypothetical protein [Vibrio parahaemolyticus]EHH1079101.1 hypothetical protein [Vibrio parahaemolyticus]
MERVKKFLEKNKIYFETLGTSIPSISALVISCFALAVSLDSTDIAQRSADIAQESADLTKNMNRPIFEVTSSPQFSHDGKLITADVVINNHGSPVLNLKMESFEFFKVECGKVGVGVWENWYPINGYYKYGFPTGTPTKDIAKFIPEDNFKKSGALYEEAIRLGGADEGFSHPFFESIIVLSYETSYGESSSKFFRASPHGFSAEIVEEEAMELIAIYKSKEKELMSVPWFDQVTALALRSSCKF